MQISFVKNDKIQLTQSIKPNAIHNRYDLLYGDDYDLLKIEEENSVSYIPFKKTNKLLGAVFGAVKAVLVTAVLCAVLVFVKRLAA